MEALLFMHPMPYFWIFVATLTASSYKNIRNKYVDIILFLCKVLPS
jgi:hypothetical protein